MKKILKFSATWCSPCKIISKTLKDSIFDDVEIIEIDIDNDPDGLTEQYNVRNIPTLIYFVNDQQVNKTTGSISKEKILESFNV